MSLRGQRTNSYRTSMGNTIGKHPLGRPRSRLEYSIKVFLKEAGYDIERWMQIAQDCAQ
jgi:hypothetical protein